jgi:hypothetical protein
VTPSAGRDRYEPLPGMLEIPGHFWRRLSPRGRLLAKLAGGVVLVAAAIGLVLAIPAIDDGKRERSAAEQQADAQRRADRTAALQAEQRILRGTGTPARGLEGAGALAARRALAGDLVLAVERDARERVASGELSGTIQDVDCERYPRGARNEDPAAALSRPTGRYACLAITSVVPSTEFNESSRIGYPYRALVDFPAGTFAYCKVSGRPGEGSIARSPVVRVPRACGGNT